MNIAHKKFTRKNVKDACLGIFCKPVHRIGKLISPSIPRKETHKFSEKLEQVKFQDWRPHERLKEHESKSLNSNSWSYQKDVIL